VTQRKTDIAVVGARMVLVKTKHRLPPSARTSWAQARKIERMTPASRLKFEEHYGTHR